MNGVDMKNKIENIESLEELQKLYSDTFGKNGTMTAKLKNMKNLSNEERAEINAENAKLRNLFKEKQNEKIPKVCDEYMKSRFLQSLRVAS